MLCLTELAPWGFVGSVAVLSNQSNPARTSGQ